MSRENTSGRGVFAHYGPRTTAEKYGGIQNVGGRVKEIVYKIAYNDLPGGTTDDVAAYVPAGAVVLDAYVNVTTAFAGGTAYDIGLEQSDGSTAIDADGLFDGLALEDINATVGTALTAALHAGTNSGVLCGQKLSVNGYLVAAAAGTFTAGEATVTVRYTV